MIIHTTNFFKVVNMIKKIFLLLIILLFSVSVAFATNMNDLEIPHDFSGKKLMENTSYLKLMIILDSL